MHFRLSVKEILSKLVIAFLLSGFIGYLFDAALLMLGLCAFGFLVWHYHHLLTLTRWLWHSNAIFPPQAKGVWGRIYDGLYRQKKQHRQKLKQLNDTIRQFRDGAEALPDAALVLSNELTILWGNKKAQHILGIRWPSDVGQRIDNLLRFPEFTQYLETNSFEHPCLIPSPHNNELRIELRLMPYGSEQILMLARDVSKIYRLEEMRRDFVANVSHELKTPLTVVRGYVEMVQLTEHSLDPQWKKAFATIEGQVTRMDRLVEQLLILSRVEIQADDEEKHSVDVPKLLYGLIDDAQWLNQDKQHKILADIDETLKIKGVESELKSAFSNLIANAIAYTANNGEVSISWQIEGNKAKFSVKDNGAGIRPEDINRLTERFFRVDKSRSRDTGGSGLGLAIVKHVLNHHNASLSINSQFGKGSEFFVVFERENIL
ncbi:phosphate regulon sensor histidine kinase PhoR [Thalassotalea piscium]|uniref:Phosphate regulon sensor protein PhoR n=1 Tax=Thalassotalea piscium TaxID=1230533 RepID=A0A7X0TTX1_9GAMM|nr:phosphate regulon sensor histidine kinase PhoR [Thalassotalea piscium]MBB6543598.1 two-component system phosphate regulon sensor histidine kinase PhoR [Thalassotalea piscium]